MKRPTLAALLAAALLFPAAATAQGLRPGIAPNTRPAFSPYLNLLRPGTSPALNYYGLVRPELAFRDSIQTLQGDVATNRRLITTGQGGAAGEVTTGHNARYLNTGGYFLNMTGGTGGTGGGGTPAGRPAGLQGGGARAGGKAPAKAPAGGKGK